MLDESVLEKEDYVRGKVFAIITLVAVLIVPTVARADNFTTWTLQGFSFLSGSFTLDDTTTGLVDWNITSSAGTISNGLNIPATVSIPGYTYTVVDSGVSGVAGAPCGVGGVIADSAGGIVVFSCDGTGTSLTLLAPIEPATGGGLATVSGTLTVNVAEQEANPGSSLLSPVCSTGNPSSEPCSAYFRDDSGTIVGVESSVSAAEPSSLLMLAFALASVAALAFGKRRRILQPL